MMVGMVVGLITIIIIMQSFAAFEGQKRTTTNSADAQENGLIALRSIQTEAHMAGAGLVTATGLTCSSMNWYYNGATGTSPIAPVIIANGLGGASDAISLTYSDSPFSSSPAMLTASMLTSDAGVSMDTINMSGFKINSDKFLVATPSVISGGLPCSRLAYVDTTVVSPSSAGIALFNPPPTINIFPSGAVNGYTGFDSFAINMGNFIQNKYSILANDLVVTDVSMPNQQPLVIANNIVNIQAQYGVAPVNPSIGSPAPAVNCWTDAVGAACNPESGDWANPSAADILRVKAIRIAVVARSSLQEKAVGGACTATTAPPTSWAGGPVIDLSANPNWKCHRYNVYQTVIPLRNVIWANL